eukprot:5047253-Pyramimonas_sp.AAC.2
MVPLACMYLMAVLTSLSPRPLKLRTTFCPGGNVGTNVFMNASAWEVSSAGMMPSFCEVYENASIASASVTEKYSARPMSRRKECSGPMPG